MPCRGCRAGGRQRGTAAIETIQQAAGLEEQTMEYLLKYRCGDDLVKKLAAAIDKKNGQKEPLRLCVGGAVFRVVYRVACLNFSLIF